MKNSGQFSGYCGRGVFLALGAALLAISLSVPADAFWSRDNLRPFNPDTNAPQPYDPGSVGYGGVGGPGGSSSDCYWSREQTYVAGRLVWRPLLMCNYPSN